MSDGDKNRPTKGDLLAVCSWCNSADYMGDRKFILKREDNLVFYDNLIERYGLDVTHGLCDDCSEGELAKLRR